MGILSKFLRFLGIPPEWVLAFLFATLLTYLWFVFLGKLLKEKTFQDILVNSLFVGGVVVIWLIVLVITYLRLSQLPKATARDKIGLWVARFEQDPDRKEQLSLIRQIENVVTQEKDLKDVVEVRDLGRTIKGKVPRERLRQAQYFGRRVNATILLYGDISEELGKSVFFPYITLVQTYVVVKREEIPVEKLTEAKLAELESLKLPRTDVHKAIGLTKLLTGFSYYGRRQYLRALDVFAQVLQSKLEDIDATVVQFYIGNCNLDISKTMATPMKWLRQAVSAFSAIILDLTDKDLYVMTQNNLGIAYSKLSAHQEPVSNLEKAIEAYKEALRFCSPEAAPLDYAGIQNNLGSAYSRLASHQEPVSNLEKAIEAYKEALRFRTPDATPLGYVMTQNNLGVAYRRLSAHQEPVSNLEKAIEAYKEALRFCSPEAAPLGYVMTQNNLAYAYSKLSAHQEPVSNLEKAIEAYKEALRFRTPDATPLDYATTQNNLGIAYRRLSAHQEPVSNLEKAIEACKEALRFRTRGKTPSAYAETQYNIGLTHLQIFQITHSLDDREKAIQAFRSVLSATSPHYRVYEYAQVQLERLGGS